MPTPAQRPTPPTPVIRVPFGPMPGGTPVIAPDPLGVTIGPGGIRPGTGGR